MIVGSGVGGAVLANELSQKGINITILEAGKYEKLGTERRSLNFYTRSSYFSPSEKSVEGSIQQIFSSSAGCKFHSVSTPKPYFSLV